MISTTISVAGRISCITFTPDEPQHVWHAPAAPTDQPAARFERPAPRTVRLPVVTMAVVLLLPGAVLLARRVRPAGRAALAAGLIGVVLAGAAAGYRPLEVPDPWAGEGYLPPEGEAKAIFASLHRNIYRAFDYSTESDVYDTLARSVDGALLDWVYNEVYQSLILRDADGAVCRVEKVNILDSSIAPPAAGAEAKTSFRVRARWRVLGAVAHWGHVHKRTNEYEAVYTVARRKQAWKIVHVDVIRQERLVPDDPPSGTGATGATTRSG